MKYMVTVLELWTHEVEAQDEHEARRQAEEYGVITPSYSGITHTTNTHRAVVEVKEDIHA